MSLTKVHLLAFSCASDHNQRAQEEHVAVAENINKAVFVCKDMIRKTKCGRTQH